jgi:hypothetical protein
METHLVYAEDLTPNVWVQGPPREQQHAQTSRSFVFQVGPPEPQEPTVLWVKEARRYGNIVSVILFDPVDGSEHSLQIPEWAHLSIVDGYEPLANLSPDQFVREEPS